MLSITIISSLLFVVFATANAIDCPPVLCMIACPYGFEANEIGCPICSCRKTPQVCVEPISGYNCGSIDHRDCPSSHECQFDFSGITGRCCLKVSGSSTPRPPTGSSTARPPTGSSTARPPTGSSTARPPTGTTTGPRTSTRRLLNLMVERVTGSFPSTTRSPGSTNQGTRSTIRPTRPSTTTGRATGTHSSTQRSL